VNHPAREVVLTILPEGTDLVVRKGETMFHALRRYGYALRAGCREGGCGVCIVEIVSGETFDLLPVAPTVLSDEDRAGGLCLPCRAVPTTDVVIRLDSTDSLRRSPYSDKLAAKDLAKHESDAQS
jgi:ferredoxin